MDLHSGVERSFPWGSEAPGPEHGYFDFDALGSRAGERFPARTQRVRSGWTPGQWLGVDRESV